MEKVVTYLRVSTARQGVSGLGLAAQQKAVEQFAASKSARIVGSFKEVESGKRSDRPELDKALHLAKVTGSTLVIAKLDRLSRNAHFLLGLAKSGVKFVAADMPEATELTVGIMALVAEQEAKAISKRTKEALQAAKARGQVLGNPNGAAALRRAGKGNGAAVEVVRAKADARALALKIVIESLREEGVVSLGGIAEALNEGGMETPRGGRWHKTSVSNLLARFA